MSSATSGPGFLLKVSVHNAASYTTIAEMKDISGPEQTADLVDVTNQSSPNNYKEWLPTLLDGGHLTGPCNFIPTDASQTGLLTDLQARTLMDFEQTMGTTGKAFFFSGYVVKFGVKLPVANVVASDIDIKITGPVTGPSNSV